eukprot:2331880-Prymnesium_polylepis.1
MTSGGRNVGDPSVPHPPLTRSAPARPPARLSGGNKHSLRPRALRRVSPHRTLEPRSRASVTPPTFFSRARLPLCACAPSGSLFLSRSRSGTDCGPALEHLYGWHAGHPTGLASDCEFVGRRRGHPRKFGPPAHKHVISCGVPAAHHAVAAFSHRSPIASG